MRKLILLLPFVLVLGAVAAGIWKIHKDEKSADFAWRAFAQERADGMNRLADMMTTGIQRSLDCWEEQPNDSSVECDIFVGRCAGFTAHGSRNILIGDYTATPTPDASGFINIGNQFCAWRDTKQVVACPPPVPPDCDAELAASAPAQSSVPVPAHQ